MATQITIQTETKSDGGRDYALLRLVGQVDESNLTDFSETLDGLIGSDTQHLMLHLADLEFINSKVIGYLAATHGRLGETNQKMIFVAPNQNILDILELVGLTQIVPTHETEEDALRALLDEEL